MSAADDTASTTPEFTVTINVLANDTYDGLAGVDSVTQGSNGNVSVLDYDTVAYTPNADFAGTDSFTYTAIDDWDGSTSTATVTVTVNSAPQASADTATTAEDTPVLIDVLANDSDPDGDTLTITQVKSGPSDGSTEITNGKIAYTPNSNHNGSDSFTYTITDGTTERDAMVSVTINAVNDAPTTTADSGTTDEDTSITIDVLANDNDVDSGDTLTVTDVTQGTDGTVSFTSPNVTYEPNLNFNGSDSFTYTVSDGTTTSTETVSITVSSVNDAPVASDDTGSTDEDTSVTLNVLTNDSDIDGDTLTISSVTQGTNGSVSNGTTDLTYKPDANFNGSDSFTYTISDGNGGTSTATVSMTVSSVNDSPVASDDSASTDEDTAVTVTVLSNDSDADDDTLSVSAVTQGTDGKVTHTTTGVTYTPDANFNGSDSFTYTVSDGNNGSDTATVSITVNSVNDAPVATNDSDSTNEDTSVTIHVLTDDTDADGDSLTVSGATQPTHGSVTRDASSVTYTPDANYNGNDAFTYTVSDGNGGTDTGNVAITVKSVNDAPVAADDSKTTDEDTPAVIDVLANDTDVDGDTLLVDSVTQPTHGKALIDIGAASVTYTPDANYNGSDSFTYTVKDGNGGTHTATVSMTVNSVNDAPVAADDTGSTPEDTAVTVDVMANDKDVDGDVLKISSVTQPANGSVANNGSDVTYGPNTDFNGSDSFTYTVSDGNGGTHTATVEITVSAVNDAPVATHDSGSGDEDTSITVDVLANDTDTEDDALKISSFTQPTNGEVTQGTTGLTYTPVDNFNGWDSFTYTVDDGNGGTDTAKVAVTVNPVNDAPVAQDDAQATKEDIAVKIDVLSNDYDVDTNDSPKITAIATAPSNGTAKHDGLSVTYTPAENFNGEDTFVYEVADGDGVTDTATVTVTVGADNDAPVANDDSASTDEDISVTIDVLANDTDVDGDTLEVSSATPPSHGSVTVTAQDLTYSPNNNYIGDDSFKYTIIDGNGGSASATVTITVGGVNDTPNATDDAAATNEDTAVTIDVLANDTDADGDSLTISATTSPSNGTLTNNGTDVTYTPDADFHGSDSFTYTAADGNGGTNTATVSVTIDAVNDAPDAQDDAYEVAEDGSKTLDVLANDSDVDGDSISIQSFTEPTNGSLIENGTAFTYTAKADFHGSDSFTYTIGDGNGASTTATVSITVTAENDAPTWVSPTPDANAILTVLEGNELTFTMAATDADGDSLTFDVETLPANASFNPSTGGFAWTPSWENNGTTLLTMSASDGQATIEREISIEVTIVDQDDDGLPDAFERENGLDPTTQDTDRDTISDEEEIGDLFDPRDTDGDRLLDALDDDSDDDMLPDSVEAGDDDLTTPPVDTDDDGTPDYRDQDSDDDDVFDIDDNCPVTMNDSQADADADGEGDACEDDTDGDGLPDIIEVDAGLDPALLDTDGDFIDDGTEFGDDLEMALDTDADGLIDALDDDSDGDSILDVDEAGDEDLATEPLDTDGDGTPDYRDTDADGDGIDDGSDNCRLVANNDQADTDSDGEGDACTDDIDGDGVTDDADNCPMVANDDQSDADGDGSGDACDNDDDGDGVADSSDDCPYEAAATDDGCPASDESSDEDSDDASSDEDPTTEEPSADGSDVDEDPMSDTDEDHGGCSSAKATPNGTFVLMLLALVGLRRRKRRAA